MPPEPLPNSTYRVASTSRKSADVSDKVLQVTQTTRTVLRAQLVDNPKNPDAAIRLTIVHQKKGTKGNWEDPSEIPLSKLTSGELRCFHMRSEATLNLYAALRELYAVHQSMGISQGVEDIVVAKAKEVIQAPEEIARAIGNLLNQGRGEDLWSLFRGINPDTLDHLSQNLVLARRSAALGIFKSMLQRSLSEREWEAFFRKHRWIFGYGLDYRFLSAIQDQPQYGGTTVTGGGGQRGDQLHSTHGNVQYTVLVEIKKPNTRLLNDQSYRNGAYSVSSELAGGVAQLQSCCRQWEVDGSRTDENRELMAAVKTVRPKGILVIGNTSELQDFQRCKSFELFRSHLNGIAILTYDELYERASFICSSQA